MTKITAACGQEYHGDDRCVCAETHWIAATAGIPSY